MDIVSLVILLILSPVLVKLVDRGWVSFKKSELFKDLLEEENKK